MSEEIRRVDIRSLLNRIRGPKIYVDPKTGRVSDSPSRDSAPVPKTTWWKDELDSLLSPEAIEIVSSHALEMARYFPDFELYTDERSLFWLGKIDGIGKIKITYPLTFPAQKFEIQALDLSGSFTEEVKKIVWEHEDITPAGAIIVLMRYFLLTLFPREGEKKCNGT